MEIYPARGSKKISKKGTGSVAPKYRNPSNLSETWSGRGRQPLWFAVAIKKRGVTVENLLIGGAPKATPAAMASKKTAKKPARKKVAKG